jgi:O-antigen ligase
MEDDQSSIERLALQGSAVSAFLASPLLGSAFVEPLEFTYPHNLFIETALALGVVGLALLTPLLVRCVRGALGLARRGRLFLPMLFMQYFVGSQLSGAIWGNAAFWASGTLLLVWVATGPVAERRRYSQRAPVRLRSHPA